MGNHEYDHESEINFAVVNLETLCPSPGNKSPHTRHLKTHIICSRLALSLYEGSTESTLSETRNLTHAEALRRNVQKAAPARGPALEKPERPRESGMMAFCLGIFVQVRRKSTAKPSRFRRFPGSVPQGATDPLSASPRIPGSPNQSPGFPTPCPT